MFFQGHTFGPPAHTCEHMYVGFVSFLATTLFFQHIPIIFNEIGSDVEHHAVLRFCE